MFNASVADALARDRVRERRGSAARAETGIAGALQYAAPFSLCSKRELKLVAKAAKLRTLRKGAILTAEGEPGDCMFVLISGGANVHKGGRKIAELGSGDTIGELAALTKMPRNATVTMRTDGEVALISRRDLHRLLEEAPGFSRKLLEALANRVRELDRKLVV
jgi:CRP-like cAMP-binding protein